MRAVADRVKELAVGEDATAAEAVEAAAGEAAGASIPPGRYPDL